MTFSIAQFVQEVDSVFAARLIPPCLRVSRQELLKHGVIIYGAAVWGEYVVANLKQVGITPDWIVDKRAESGARPIDSLREAGERYVIPASTHIQDMASTCVEMGVKKWALPAALRDWLPLIGEVGLCADGERHTAELSAVYQLLADDKSREILRSFVRWHTVFDNDFSELQDPVFYFPNDLRGRVDYSVFADVGAFCGDTLTDYIREAAPVYHDFRYFAFEPDAVSFSRLCAKINSLPENLRRGISARKCALGRAEGTMDILSLGKGITVSADTGGGTPIHTLDSLFQSVKKAPTIIKADIEGAEIDMLTGAEQTIRDHRPTLAVSVYHHFRDVWEIPRWIADLGLDYDIYLRHHENKFSDTVCYALPKR